MPKPKQKHINWPHTNRPHDSDHGHYYARVVPVRHNNWQHTNRPHGSDHGHPVRHLLNKTFRPSGAV